MLSLYTGLTWDQILNLKWEQIKKIELTPKVWTIDDGLLTPTLKLKRKAIKEEFQDLYDRMYKS